MSPPWPLPILLGLVFTAHAAAAPLRVEVPQNPWSIGQILTQDDSFWKTSTPTVWFIRVQGLGNTYVAVFSDQSLMNQALLRAGIFISTQEGLIDGDEYKNHRLHQLVRGHDFKGRDLQAFLLASAKLKALLPDEATFKKSVLEPLVESHGSDFSLIAGFPWERYSTNLSHELLHAIFYHDPAFRAAALEFWEHQVSTESKNLFIRTLQPIYAFPTLDSPEYRDPGKLEFVVTEFLSHVLQINSWSYMESHPVLSPLAPLVSEYRAPLLEHLKDVPIFMEFVPTLHSLDTDCLRALGIAKP